MSTRRHGDRVAVVTGGGSGIGLATVHRLVADGLRVAVLDLAPTASATGAALTLQVDVTDPAGVDEAFAQVTDAFGRLDVLVSNAGISGSPEATVCHTTPVDEWDRVLAVNVRGPFLCARAALPPMLRQGSGHIINVASTAGLVAFPGRSAYTTSKGATVSFTRSLAADYASAGIRANAVCPGMVETPMTRWRLEVPRLRAEVEAKVPLGRVAQPDDIADAVSLLASERLAYLTGHCLVLDGGWTAL